MNEDGEKRMINEVTNTILFCDYFEKWIEVYKKGAIRDLITLHQYKSQ